MLFFIGWLCGLGSLPAHRLLRRWVIRRRLCHGVEKPGRTQPGRLTRGAWEQTRNFLYYDGTEMPVSKRVKEDTHDESK